MQSDQTLEVGVLNRKRSLWSAKQNRSRRARRAGLACTLIAMAAALLVAFAPAAGAATTGPVGLSGPPDPDTVCSGGIVKDAAGTNQLDYTFTCQPLSTANGQTGNVLSFTVEAIRPQDDLNNVQNFDVPTAFYALDNPLAAGYSATATGPSTTVDTLASDISCQGGAGSGIDGIDCYEPEPSATADGYVPSGDYVEGSVNLDEPYCSYLPEGAKPGTAAVPQAEIELVVTDSTGAEDGPFELDLPKGCPKVPAVVPPFTLSSVKTARNAVTLTSHLPFAGKLAAKLTAGNTVVGTAAKTVTKAGVATLSVSLDATGKRLLTQALKAGRHGLSVALQASYDPKGGRAQTASRTGLLLK